MFGALRNLFGSASRAPAFERPRLHMQEWPAAIYAVGDVHGCVTQARQIEQLIAEDARAFPGEKLIVYLGDYVDRGPDTAGVLDFLQTRAPQGFRRVCLAGNHEIMMVAFFDNPRNGADWLEFGGIETLFSYGISATALSARNLRDRRALLESHIPSDHVAWLRELPLTLSVPGCVFVHAGLRPGVPLDQQQENDLLWIRREFFDAPAEPGSLVVHGHTPNPVPVVLPGRICVDTGAFATGILTAVRLMQGAPPHLISTPAN